MEAVLIGPYGRTALGATSVKIGRASDNQIAIPDDVKASGHHAEIRPMGNGYCIVDVGSTNGTLVDEQPIPARKPYQLYSKSSIRIGDTNFTYETVDMQIPSTVFVDKAGEISPTVAADSPFKTVSAPDPSDQQGPDYPQLPPLPERRRGADKKAGKAQQQPKDKQRNQQPPVKKKGRVGMWMSVVILVLFLAALIAGGVFAYNVYNMYFPHSTPQQTLTTFCTDLKNGNYPDAYQQLSKQDQSTTSEAQFTQEVSNAVGRGGGLKDCAFENVSIDSSDATKAHGRLLYTVFAFPNRPLPSPAQLVLENNTWKLTNVKMPSAG